MIRSHHLASVAFAAFLALPAVAMAQPAQIPTAANAPAAAPAAASPMPSAEAPAGSAQQRVEEHIRQLHAQLQITSNEQPQWDQFANVMRQNAQAMDAEFAQRVQQFRTMDAVQNMQSYERIAEAHVQHLQKLVPAFEDLYNAMPEQQKRLTDQVFRANAESNANRHMQTGSNAQR